MDTDREKEIRRCRKRDSQDMIINTIHYKKYFKLTTS